MPKKVEISDEALKDGETAVSTAVIDAAKKAHQDSMAKMQQMMVSMQTEIAQETAKGQK